MRYAIAALLLLVVLCAGERARAEDAPKLIDHYKRSVWTFEDGAPIAVADITQGGDGYLWLANPSGLTRFDGVQFETIAPQAGPHPPSRSITALLVARSGTIWAGHFWGGISIYRNGRLVDANPTKPNGVVYRIVEDREGAVWVASDGIHKTGLRRYFRGRWDILDKSWGLPPQHFSDMLAARDGTLWVVLTDCVLHLARGARHFTVIPGSYELGTTLAEASDGKIWIFNGKGVRPFVPEGRAGGAGTAPSPDRTRYRMLIDRHNQMWLSGGDIAPASLMHLERAKDTDLIVRNAIPQVAEESSGALFEEDREGNIWITTATTLVRYRRADLVTVIPAGLANNRSSNAKDVVSSAGTVFATPGGTARVFEIDRGMPPRSLPGFPGRVSSSCGDGHGGIWLIRQEGGPVHLTAGRWTVAQPTSLVDGPLSGKCTVDVGGRLWVTANEQGLLVYDRGRWSREQVGAEPANVWPYAIAADGEGAIWAYYGTRDLVRIKDGLTRTMWKRADNPIGLIGVIYVAHGLVWLGGDTGLALYDGKSVRALTNARFSFLNDLGGLAETRDGTLWMMTDQGIVSMSKVDLLAAFDNPKRSLKPRIFNTADGLPGSSTFVGSTNHIAVGDDGRLWFTLASGIVTIDPAHLVHNPLAPAVLIRELATEDRAYAASASLALPAGASNLRIDYTATSLTIPERVQFRYQMLGVDADWVDPGRRRQAFYTNLGPGTYTFRVIAANNDGVWNRTGATMVFTIPPTFLQSYLFKALMALVVVAMLALLYQLRLRALERTMRIRAEERLTERERIARELHDTLLQGFQALVLRLQNVIDRMPAGEPIRIGIEQELERAEATLAEGRNRVRDIRGQSSTSDIEALFTDAAQVAGAANFKYSVIGPVRDLHSLVRDELCKIGLEAIHNACRHAAAKNIAARVVYGRTLLLLNVSDDGVGIDPETLNGVGRTDRYGLVGMRERAQRIQSRFKITSIKGRGTTVEVAIPARVAYVTTRGWLRGFLRRPALET